jgi:DNA-binding MarR family transcriptional regulator
MTTNRVKLIEEIMESFHTIKNKMQAKVAQYEEKDCVTHSQLFVLAIIERRHNIGIKELSQKFHISPSAITQLVDGLVDKGYVIRKADSKDRRASQLELSARGLKHITVLKNKHMKMVSVLFGKLSNEELKTYTRLHKKILSSFLDRK